MIDAIIAGLEAPRRVALVATISAAAVAVSGLYLQRARAALHPPMIHLKLAARRDAVALVLRSWGVPGRKRATKILLVDFIFGVSLATLLAMISWAGAVHFIHTDRWWLQELGRGRLLGLLFTTLMAGFDVLENIGALLMIRGVHRFIPRVTAFCSGLKFVTGSLAFLYPTLMLMCFEVEMLTHAWIWLKPLVVPMTTWLGSTLMALGPAALRLLRQFLR